MKGESNLKTYLIDIAERMTAHTTLDEVYDLLALYADIDQSEKEIEEGNTLSQNQVEKEAEGWLK